MSDHEGGPPPSPASIALRVLGNIGQNIVTAATQAAPPKGRKGAAAGAAKAPKKDGPGCTPCAAYARVFDAQQGAAALRKSVLGGKAVR